MMTREEEKEFGQWLLKKMRSKPKEPWQIRYEQRMDAVEDGTYLQDPVTRKNRDELWEMQKARMKKQQEEMAKRKQDANTSPTSEA